ncbi:hypothetical protein M407DRAFT_18547 [Tulasnella calospora MUT 4182]|uniref:Uncharacterized protein n=1 Tax=Tulasnella calospora MUT 4182 TaxID=1051891 RepID=A0A0C3LEW5_9AGAM|nr:hypothetical protein M407DRAFT_18547 [Tulasnella calospora MUT 4182]
MLIGVRSAISISRAAKGFNWREFISAVTDKRWVDSLIHGRSPESRESLQIITLKRAICTSDDPATLLYATSNIIGIKKRGQMEQLWSDRTFQERFLEQYRNSYAQMLQLRGRDQVDIAVAARRLYCGAAAHIMLVLDSDPDPGNPSPLGALQRALQPFISIALGRIRGPSIYLVRATLRLPIPEFDGDQPPDKTVNDIYELLKTYSSDTTTHADWRLVSVITWVAVNLRMITKIKHSPQQTCGGDIESIIQTLGEALAILTGPKRKELGDCDGVLTIMLHGIRRTIVGRVHPRITLQHRFALLEICERILHSPHLPETAQERIREIRRDMAEAWKQELTYRATNSRHRIPVWLVDILERYIRGLQMIYPTDSGYDQYIEVLQAFGRPIRELFSYGPNAWANKAGFRTRFGFRKTFDAFLLNIDNMAHQSHAQAQETVPQTARDPDERRLHSQENTADLRAMYSLPVDQPDSQWHQIQEHLERGASLPQTVSIEHSPDGSVARNLESPLH